MIDNQPRRATKTIVGSIRRSSRHIAMPLVYPGATTGIRQNIVEPRGTALHSDSRVAPRARRLRAAGSAAGFQALQRLCGARAGRNRRPRVQKRPSRVWTIDTCARVCGLRTFRA